MSTRTEPAGIAARLAAPDPAKPAIIYASGDGWAQKTYGELDAESSGYAALFARLGIGRGTKTILMLKPGPELFTVLFGLFKIGAVPVVVDPGMGVRRMLHCYRTVGAEAFIGIPLAHVIRVLNPRTFRTVKTTVTAGRRWFWGGEKLSGGSGATVEGASEPQDLLIINFTTGSTGPAKGVEYTHGMLDAMLRQVVAAHGLGPDGVSVVTLPLFGLFDLLLGATSVLPGVDPTKVASTDPRIVTAAIERFGATTMFASPALVRRVGELGRPLPTLRALVSGGAPVSEEIVASVHPLVTSGLYTTYGATEALPIATISSDDILGDTREQTRAGTGTCVGAPVDGLDVRIIEVTDQPLPTWTDSLLVKPGTVGEIAIAGPTVSPRYHAPAEANVAAKIADGDRLWHRTGDLGHLDDAGRLWFAGRKAQRVRTSAGTLHTVRCEGIFNAHPDIHRTALVGIGVAGRQRPVLCVELRDGVPAHERPRIARELRALAAWHEQTEQIEDFLFHPAFPVDIRHNAKIGREELAEWAAGQLNPPSLLKALAPRAVPIGGWLYLLYGVLAGFDHPLLWALFWIDAFLSVVVHAAQIPLALPRARHAGYGPAATTALTMLFGATWWKALAPRGTA
jgi:acyl-CoA synthetase (AMP-forming)/AMP-acid ligase II